MTHSFPWRMKLLGFALAIVAGAALLLLGLVRLLHGSLHTWWAVSFMVFIAASGWLFAFAQSYRRTAHASPTEAPTDETEATVSQLVETFCLSVELKDPYTRGHSERVAAYLLLLAEKVYGRLDAKTQARLHYAGLLHDVGKIYIPEHILKKPTKLVTDEFQYIRKHPQIGADIVAKIPSLASTIPVILHHHERYDGRGYPVGLKGGEIPLDARIAAVADTFDAMTSMRAYRGALNLDTALQEIISNSGSQFDPEVVNQFVHHYDGFRRLHQELHRQTWLPTAGL